MIHKLQIRATNLRPNNFFQNDGQPVVQASEYPMAIGKLGVSIVDLRDIAETAALSLIKRYQFPEPQLIERIEIYGPDVINSESAVARCRKSWVERSQSPAMICKRPNRVPRHLCRARWVTKLWHVSRIPQARDVFGPNMLSTELPPR
jgi:hypothetical protein